MNPQQQALFDQWYATWSTQSVGSVLNSTLSDDAVAAAFNAQLAPQALQGPIWVSYRTLQSLPAPFGFNASGKIRANLQAWINSGTDLSGGNPASAMPNPAALALLDADLASPGDQGGIDLTDPSVPAMLTLFASTPISGQPAVLTADQATALTAMTVGPTPAPITTADVTAERANLTRTAITQWWGSCQYAVALLFNNNAIPTKAAIQAVIAAS